MRIDSAATLIFLLLLAGLAATPAISQDAADSGSHHSSPQITNISVAGRSDNVDVEITFSKLVRAEVITLEHPDRLVFDFPGCELSHPGQRLAVNRGTVVAVRAAEFSVTPPIARVVIDLKSAQDHEESYAGNKLIIKLNSTAGARHPASASGGNNPTANSSPLTPKSAPSEDAHTATIPLDVYALLAKARTLNVPELERLEAKAQAGDLESETTLGLAYHAGILLKIDDAEALRLLRHAANHGFMAAEEAMGIFCHAGFGMPPDKTQAVSWYTKAAQQGSKDAATNLGLMYSTGDGIPKDAAKAANWFRSAAEAGDATAQLNLAALYHRGEGLPQDDAQAVLWLTKAADHGLVPAMVELAKWDLRPEHGRNLDAAIGWYKKAAGLGDASAQAGLGAIFADEKLGRLDYAQAVLWYRKAADQGQREGELGLGMRYLYGQGVAKNPEEARRWLTLSANQGHPYAQFLLAKMCESGEGGPVDAASATKYYELAANYGIPEAQYRFGLLLSADRGNAANLVAAYKWLVLAQDTMKESATSAQELRTLLTPPQLAQAESEINEWRAAHPPRHSGTVPVPPSQSQSH
jgi:TPR repeat protein